MRLKSCHIFLSAIQIGQGIMEVSVCNSFVSLQSGSAEIHVNVFGISDNSGQMG